MSFNEDELLTLVKKHKRPFEITEQDNTGIQEHLSLAKEYIQVHIKPIEKKYSYPNEQNMNPAYQDVASITNHLSPGEVRIWVLRSDFILATGVKNAYKKRYGYSGFFDSFDPELHHLMDRNDRYGHPSLALAEANYDGSVYYAGYLCQRKGFLQVYLSSGRFEREDLTNDQRSILEAYIAYQLQSAYGLQDLVFDNGNSDNPVYHQAFFSAGYEGRGTIEGTPSRRYDRKSIETILNNLSMIGRTQEQYFLTGDPRDEFNAKQSHHP